MCNLTSRLDRIARHFPLRPTISIDEQNRHLAVPAALSNARSQCLDVRAKGIGAIDALARSHLAERRNLLLFVVCPGPLGASDWVKLIWSAPRFREARIVTKITALTLLLCFCNNYGADPIVLIDGATQWSQSRRLD